MIIIGIDGDINGGIAVIRYNTISCMITDSYIHKMPCAYVNTKPNKIVDFIELRDLIFGEIQKNIQEECWIACETGHGRPNQNTTATWTQAYNLAIIHSVLRDLQDQYPKTITYIEYVYAIKWHNAFPSIKRINFDNKNKTIEAKKKIIKDIIFQESCKYFNEKEMTGPRQGKLYGLSDAAGIAIWKYRNMVSNMKRRNTRNKGKNKNNG